MLYFTQAPIDRECYMKIQKIMDVHSDTEWVIKSNKNIYKHCQENRVWNKLLV